MIPRERQTGIDQENEGDAGILEKNGMRYQTFGKQLNKVTDDPSQ